jgi:hypothetical protein
MVKRKKESKMVYDELGLWIKVKDYS